MKIQNSVAFVTGAGRNIGRSIALGFAAEAGLVAQLRQQLLHAGSPEPRAHDLSTIGHGC